MTDRLPDLFSYIIDTDSGFAPNPFSSICTLACCKPKIRQYANIGDWIIGTTPSPDKGRLIYAMRVERGLTFDLYYEYPEYEIKKPNKGNGCGDNIYMKGSDGRLVQLPNLSHNEKHIKRDIGVNRVLISKTFYYFGMEAPKIPNQFKFIIHTVQGHKRIKPTSKNYSTVTEFLEWLEANFKQGIHGNPANLKEKCKIPILEEKQQDLPNK